jgi:hypothetical protein
MNAELSSSLSVMEEHVGIPVLRSVVATGLLLMSLAPALGEVRILASPGGEATGYLKLFALVEQSGEQVVIDGPCFSACTLVLSVVPRDRICVTPRAVFGFHAAQLVDEHGRRSPAREATRLVAASYPTGVRTWINQHGGLTAKPIFLRGRELAGLFPHCS